METGKRVPVKATLKSHCWIDANDYQSLYQQSLQDSVGFWRSQAQRIDWLREPQHIRDTRFHPDDVHIRWFNDGELNASSNCIDLTWPAMAMRSPCIGKRMNPANRAGRSPTRPCTCMSASLPIRSSDRVSAKATG